MAELVVKSKSSSGIRTISDTVLNSTFPIWGVASPISMLVVLIAIVVNWQQSRSAEQVELISFFMFLLSLTIGALLAQRSLAADCLIVDREGIKLPRLMGHKINFQNYISWQDISNISASVSSTDLDKSRLTIYKKRGRPVNLTTRVLTADFLEQFLIAAKMWAPALCDPSLDEFEKVLLIGARESKESSYTELWEDELGRRFCPTSYIPLEPGKSLRNNSLKVMNHLASGGLSALYLCQLDGKQLVVLKEATIPEGGAEDMKEKAREMFEREASILMKLSHPGIVPVLDSFIEGGRNYLMLGYINGIDLRQLVKQNGPQKESDVLEWAIQIANTLKYLHDREVPVIHRDLTPDNLVLRNDGQVIIVDFGAANELIGTATGTFVGKHAYISPEQFRGKTVTQSDIYAFGCTLFYLLTGVEPEALSTSNPRELAPSVSEDLAELIESCTQLEVRDRYQTVAQLLPVLKRLASQMVVL